LTPPLRDATLYALMAATLEKLRMRIVSHECDCPLEAWMRPVIIASALDHTEASSAELRPDLILSHRPFAGWGFVDRARSVSLS
jgi:hypothetical protein